MNFMSMDYFIAVAREKSFTKAASRLFITQQTLSSHIASIEKEMGCQLFVRHVPLELTFAGEIFLQYALDIQGKLDSLKKEMADISGQERGQLRIGIGHTRGHAILPPIMAAYQKQYPLMQLVLMEASNDIIQEKLLKEEIDLAIGKFSGGLPGVEQKDFYREEVVLLAAVSLLEQVYGSQKDAVLSSVTESGDLSPLSSCPFVLNKEKDIAGQIGRALLAQAGFLPNIRAVSDNIETLLDFCARGGGLCFCPENLVRATLPASLLSRLQIIRFPSGTQYMISFGYLKKPRSWSMIHNFIAVAQAFAH